MEIERIAPKSAVIELTEPIGNLFSWMLSVSSKSTTSSNVSTCAIWVWWEDEFVVSLGPDVKELFDAENRQGVVDLIVRAMAGSLSFRRRRSKRGRWFIDTGQGRLDDEIMKFDPYE